VAIGVLVIRHSLVICGFLWLALRRPDLLRLDRGRRRVLRTGMRGSRRITGRKANSRAGSYHFEVEIGSNFSFNRRRLLGPPSWSPSCP